MNQRPIREGRYVLYWMQASQRARFNHALEYAVRGANLQDIPVVVLFVLTEKFPEANLRHYGFMLEGLEEVARNLEERDILFIARCGSPEKDVPDLSGDAAMVVTDRGYLRLQKAWRRRAEEKSPCRVVEVESDAVVPADAASEKEAWSAAVLRPKIRKLLPDYLVSLTETPVKRSAAGLDLRGSMRQPSVAGLLQSLTVDRTVSPVSSCQGGPCKNTGRMKGRTCTP